MLLWIAGEILYLTIMASIIAKPDIIPEIRFQIFVSLKQSLIRLEYKKKKTCGWDFDILPFSGHF